MDVALITAMAIPMIKQFKEGLVGVGQIIKATTVAQIAGSKEAISNIGLQIMATENLTRAEKIRAIQKKAELGYDEAAAVVAILEANAEGTLTEAK